MFERFTDRARRVVVLAQEEARLLDHGHIGTEHLVLGLLREGEGVAARVLEALPLDLEDARRRVALNVTQTVTAVAGHIPFTPRAKEALEMSLREALQLGHNYIGTEHILLGLLRVEGSGAASILAQVMPPADLRVRILETMGDVQPQMAPGGPAAEGEPSPKCPSCGASLVDHMAVRRIEVTTDESPAGLTVLTAYCGVCERGLGVLPGH